MAARLNATYWRELASRLGSRLTGRRDAAVPAARTPVVRRPVRSTPRERTARFTAEVCALDAAQLDAMIEASNGLERHARDLAWDAARPHLTAPDRKELLIEVREELKRWSAGQAPGERAPALDIDTALRRRAGRALLDAAAGVIAQDRISKHDFDVLYAPFRTASTGEPLKIARRPRGSADAGIRVRVRRNPEGSGKPPGSDGVEESDDGGLEAGEEAETEPSPESALAGRR